MRLKMSAGCNDYIFYFFSLYTRKRLLLSPFKCKFAVLQFITLKKAFLINLDIQNLLLHTLGACA